MKRPALIGLGIWAVATLALRLAGQYVLRPANGPATAVLFAASLVAMVGLARAVMARVPAREERALAAIALVLPGMLLDVISAVAFDRVFPNLPVRVAGLFGGWLLFCNGIVLLTAILGGARHADT